MKTPITWEDLGMLVVCGLCLAVLIGGFIFWYRFFSDDSWWCSHDPSIDFLMHHEVAGWSNDHIFCHDIEFAPYKPYKP